MSSIGAPDFDQLVYVRLLEACNLHCQHCFIPNNPKRMDWDSIAGIPIKIKSFAKPGQTILFQLHGGEPTLVGAEFLRKVVVFLKSELADYNVKFALQTNLISYDQRFAELYREFFDGVVGVSWDPEIRLMRAGRPESNDEFEQRFWANIEQALADGLTPYMVVTVTKPLLRRYRNHLDLMQYLQGKGIKYVHFEKLTKTGYAITNWDLIGVSNREYSLWIGRFAMAYSRYVEQPRERDDRLHISPLDGLISSVRKLRRGGAGGYGCLSGTCDTRFHTFDEKGYYGACTALTAESNNRNSVGPSVADPISLVDIRMERQLDCQTCSFKPICSSGCIATPRMDESGECSGGYQAFNLLNSHLASIEDPRLIVTNA